MNLKELELLYYEEINQDVTIDERWLEVWYSQFDNRHDIIHPKGV